jgi:hypothetical protein
MSVRVTVAAVVSLAVPLPAGETACGYRTIVSQRATGRVACPVSLVALSRREAANAVGA